MPLSAADLPAILDGILDLKQTIESTPHRGDGSPIREAGDRLRRVLSPSEDGRQDIEQADLPNEVYVRLRQLWDRLSRPQWELYASADRREWDAWLGKTQELIRAAMLKDPPDGPEPPYYFRWQGERHRLTPREWQLLACLWTQERTEAEAAARAVWGDEGEDAIPESTLRALLSGLNSKLLRIGVPFEYRLRAGYIVRE